MIRLACARGQTPDMSNPIITNSKVPRVSNLDPFMLSNVPSAVATAAQPDGGTWPEYDVYREQVFELVDGFGQKSLAKCGSCVAYSNGHCVRTRQRATTQFRYNMQILEQVFAKLLRKLR